MVKPRLKVFRCSKGNPTRHSKREMVRQIDEDRNSTRAAENRTRWKGFVANSSVVPRRHSDVMGYNRIDRKYMYP